MRPQDLRALRARARAATRPEPSWLLIALAWVLGQTNKAPRPVRKPLFYLVLILSETFLPVRLVAFREAMLDQLYPESAQS